MDLSHSLRTRLSWLVRRRGRRRERRCWWCELELARAPTQIVRRHSDMGLLRGQQHHPVSQLCPNEIARLVWLNKLRLQTLEPSR